MIGVVVSACLLGSPVRHDAHRKKCDHPILQKWIEQGRVVSVCSEMPGGLGTPRPPTEIVEPRGERRVVTREGRDVTRQFKEGRERVPSSCPNFMGMENRAADTPTVRMPTADQSSPSRR